jgi:hypothetical protein
LRALQAILGIKLAVLAFVHQPPGYLASSLYNASTCRRIDARDWQGGTLVLSDSEHILSATGYKQQNQQANGSAPKVEQGAECLVFFHFVRFQ